MRNVGTAMMSWLTDQIVDLPGDYYTASDAPVTPKQPEPLDWSDCPSVSAEELEALLVPTYLLELPREDGWGNELEFCLERHDYSRSTLVVGIRSCGRDGVCQRADYVAGSFEALDFDEDLVWADGFFVRWPKKK